MKKVNTYNNFLKSLNESYKIDPSLGAKYIHDILETLSCPSSSEGEWFYSDDLAESLGKLIDHKGVSEQYLNDNGSWNQSSSDAFDEIEAEKPDDYDILVELVKKEMNLDLNEILIIEELDPPFYLQILYAKKYIENLVPSIMKSINK